MFFQGIILIPIGLVSSLFSIEFVFNSAVTEGKVVDFDFISNKSSAVYSYSVNNKNFRKKNYIKNNKAYFKSSQEKKKFLQWFFVCRANDKKQ